MLLWSMDYEMALKKPFSGLYYQERQLFYCSQLHNNLLLETQFNK